VGAEEPIGEQLEQAAVMSADEHQVRDAYGLALMLLLLSTLGLIAAGVPVSSPLAVGAAALQVLALVLTLTNIGAIGKRLATYRRVTLQLVLGLLCIYMLIGLSFSLAYLIVDMVVPSSFDPWPLKISGSVYYSFITLATVGYGDVSPVAPVARSLAVAESILGQLYLVSVVSLAVSRLGRERRAKPLEESE
jgi:hypothetical protein